MNLFILVCYIYAGIDPGMNPSYVPEYHVKITENRGEVAAYLLQTTENCRLYRGEKMDYEILSATIPSTTKVLTGVEFK
jgi:hypothetical protein